jgi:hypothetical protein
MGTLVRLVIIRFLPPEFLFLQKIGIICRPFSIMLVRPAHAAAGPEGVRTHLWTSQISYVSRTFSSPVSGMMT